MRIVQDLTKWHNYTCLDDPLRVFFLFVNGLPPELSFCCEIIEFLMRPSSMMNAFLGMEV